MEVLSGNEDASSRGIYCILMLKGESDVTASELMNAADVTSAPCMERLLTATCHDNLNSLCLCKYESIK